MDLVLNRDLSLILAIFPFIVSLMFFNLIFSLFAE